MGCQKNYSIWRTAVTHFYAKVEDRKRLASARAFQSMMRFKRLFMVRNCANGYSYSLTQRSYCELLVNETSRQCRSHLCRTRI